MHIIKVQSEAEMVKSLCQLIERIASEAVADHGSFYVGFSEILGVWSPDAKKFGKELGKLLIEASGDRCALSYFRQKISLTIQRGNAASIMGTMPVVPQRASLVKYLVTGLPHIKSDWSRWVIAFCDERVVSVDSEDSTLGAYCKQLLPEVPLLEDQFLGIKQGVSCEEAAADYRTQLRRAFKTDSDDYRFDLLLLGMGPDGHTCSLFPGHPLLDEKSLTVAPIKDSPKPPPERITLTYPVINRAKNCVFALSGVGKADVVKQILTDGEDFPAGRVKPTDGGLYWILDQSAASLL